MVNAESIKIPNDWEMVHFGDIVDYAKGFGFKSKDYTKNGVRIIRVSDTTFTSIKNNNPIFINKDDAKHYRKWELLEDDLIFSTVGSKPPMYDSLVGRAIIIDRKHQGCLLNQNAVRIRIKSKTKLKQILLLNHFRTKRYIQFIEEIYRGNANQASITLNDLFKFLIPQPKSKEEQNMIAQILSNADELIKQLDYLITKKKNIKQGTMQELLTGEKRLEGFNEKWKETTLGKIGIFTKGKGIKKTDIADTGFSCIRYAEIYTKYDVFVKETQSHISLDITKESQQIKTGNIIFTGSGETANEIGKCVVYLGTKQCFAGGDTIIFSSNRDDSLFLTFLLNFDYVQKQKSSMAQGDMVVHIYSSSLKKLKIKIPQIPEQTAIAKILSDMDSEIHELESKRGKYIMIKNGMMQKLLTGEIRLV
jgi:type I restriction enzyme, S subunit